jgi:hypothetical protein
MTFFKRLRVFALTFGVLALALGFVVLGASGGGGPGGCCWVLFCTMEPPITCWEECRPCTKLQMRKMERLEENMPGGQQTEERR